MARTQLKLGRGTTPARRGAPQMRKPRRGDWTERKEKRFFEALADSCNVTYSAGVVRFSVTCCYDRRRRDPGFREAWDEALRIGFDRLEQAMLERATNGAPRPVFHAGKEIAVITQYSDQMALHLLKSHRDSVERARLRDEQGFDPDAVFDEIKRRFAEMKAREGQG